MPGRSSGLLGTDLALSRDQRLAVTFGVKPEWPHMTVALAVRHLRIVVVLEAEAVPDDCVALSPDGYGNRTTAEISAFGAHIDHDAAVRELRSLSLHQLLK